LGTILSDELAVDNIFTDKELISNLWQMLSSEYSERDYVVRKVQYGDKRLVYYELNDHLKVYIIGLGQKGSVVFVEKKEFESGDLHIPEKH
jgi:hypothetical protein